MNWKDRVELYKNVKARLNNNKRKLDEESNQSNSKYKHYMNGNLFVINHWAGELEDCFSRNLSSELEEGRKMFLLKYAENKIYCALLNSDANFRREHLFCGCVDRNQRYIPQLNEVHKEKLHAMGSVIAFFSDFVSKYAPKEEK